MLRLSLIFCLISFQLFAQSPHGDFDMDCSECHSTDTWKIDITKMKFDHSSTEFILSGEHNKTECRSCHTSLKFNESRPACIDCHTDVHEQTLGVECSNCHTPETWIVSNITEIHQDNRFPLLGAHFTVDCENCHVSSSQLKYEPLDIACFSCHSDNYYATSSPNHIQAGFSTECEDCHNMHTESWSSLDFDHQMFPLTGGHQLGDCFECHSTNSYEGLSQQCYSCHSDDYNNVTDPDHKASLFSQNCEECHSTNPGWSPVQFLNHNDFYVLAGAHANITDCSQCHTNGYTDTPTLCYDCHTSEYTNTTNPSHNDLGFSQECESCHTQNAWIPATFDHDEQYFPIYLGSHQGEWDNCNDCHTNQSDYSVFTCIDCHEHNRTDMDDEHRGVNGYVYESNACYDCHPTGREDDFNFNHSQTTFPLDGAHLGISCNLCHLSQDENPGTLCFDCHKTEYDGVTNPNHGELKFSVNCEECHTTNPDWKPVEFKIHDQYYPLLGAHSLITDCADCHNGNYTTTFDGCNSCHSGDYNSTTDPPHSANGFSTDCESCHTENAWEPSTFDHDGEYFPIYSGEHRGEWNDCSDCHTVQSNYSIFSCIDCHEHNRNDMDDDHKEVNDYEYLSTACLDCHPDGKSDDLKIFKNFER